jgi:RNA polymerase sigma factor (sigma-70 family)
MLAHRRHLSNCVAEPGIFWDRFVAPLRGWRIFTYKYTQKETMKMKKQGSLQFSAVCKEISEHDLPETAQTHAGGYDQMARKRFWTDFYQMLDCLVKMERELFLLRFFDELSISEISRILGKGESTIKAHLYRARRKVRHRVDKIDLELEV